MKKLPILLISLFLLSVAGFSQDHGHGDDHKDEHKDEKHDDGHHGDDHHGDGHHYSKHHLALFNGGTTNIDHDATGYSLGLDYEFRFNQLLGAGLLMEYVFIGEGEAIVGIPFFVHPVGGLKGIVAPIGINAEVHDSHDDHSDDNSDDGMKAGSADTTDDHSDDHTDDHADESHGKEWQAGVRLGVGYDFHIGNLSVGPSVCADISKTTAIVYGVTIGIGF